jgi:hypothetical protein
MDPCTISDHCIFYQGDTDIACEKESPKLNGFCDDHQEYLKDFEYYSLLETGYCVRKVKVWLGENECAKGVEKKKLVVKKIFDFLIKHKNFVYRHSKFADTILSKLLEFMECYSFESEYYLKLLFPKIFDINVDQSINNIDKEQKNNFDNIVIEI